MKKVNWDKYTTFQKKVYKAILNIPKGQVLTYAQVARRIGQPKAARAVGSALARNQDAPIIPCHRVVRYNGIGNYSAPGGKKQKLKLLRKEGYTGYEA